MTKLICGWCGKEFERDTEKDKFDEFPVLICPHCGRELPASKIGSTGKLWGRKHFHIKYKDGDVA